MDTRIKALFCTALMYAPLIVLAVAYAIAPPHIGHIPAHGSLDYAGWGYSGFRGSG